MDEPIDRRAFLATVAAGAGGMALAGCSESAKTTSARGAGLRVRRPAPPGPPLPRRLEQSMRGPVFERGSPGFADAAHVYNERFDSVLPRVLARPRDSADVRGAVRWAVAHDVPLRARSGGHSYAGYSTVADGLVLDLRDLREVAVDHRAGTVTIGAGAQLIDVYASMAGQGAMIPAGSCPSVGIAGHALGGGMGLAARKFGLTTDQLIAVEMVTAAGLVSVDRRTDSDLLWALRGAGAGNFGVVTKFVFRAHPLPASAAYFFVSWPWSSASDAISAWQDWAPHARDELTSILHLNAAGGTNSVSVSGQYFGSSGDLGGLLGPLTAVAGASVSSGDRDYLSLQRLWAGCSHKGRAECHTVGTSAGGALPRDSFRAKSDFVTRPLTAAGRAAVIAALQSRSGQPGSGALLFDSYGGAINRIHQAATAFVHRNALFCIQYLSYGGGAAWLQGTHAGLRPYVSGMAYQNYIDAELPNWQHAYYGSNYRRLLATRRRVDPDHVFNFPQAIGR